MGLNGLTPDRFDKFVRENFETRWRDVDFHRLLRETMERDRIQAPAAVPEIPEEADALA